MPASKYTTSLGDMWDGVAYKVYGGAFDRPELLMVRLLVANQAHRQTVIFPAGITLTIPDIPESVSTSLPPWLR